MSSRIFISTDGIKPSSSVEKSPHHGIDAAAALSVRRNDRGDIREMDIPAGHDGFCDRTGDPLHQAVVPGSTCDFVHPFCLFKIITTAHAGRPLLLPVFILHFTTSHSQTHFIGFVSGTVFSITSAHVFLQIRGFPGGGSLPGSPGQPCRGGPSPTRSQGPVRGSPHGHPAMSGRTEDSC